MLPTTSQQGGEGGGAMETRRSRGPQWQRAVLRGGLQGGLEDESVRLPGETQKA